MSNIKLVKSKDLPTMLHIGNLVINPEQIVSIILTTRNVGVDENAPKREDGLPTPLKKDIVKITLTSNDFYYWDLDSDIGQEIQKYFYK